MEKEFVPYELALRLKALGFNEKCYGYFTRDKEFFYFDVDDLSSAYTKNMDNLVVNSVNGLECTAPLYQQAFRWFREKYEIEATTSCFYSRRLNIPYEERQYHCHVIRDGVTSKGPKYKTYEEAELACLKKLIQIVKEKL